MSGVPLYTLSLDCRYEGTQQIIFQTLDKVLVEEVKEVLEKYGKKYPSIEQETTIELLQQIQRLDDQVSAYLGNPSMSFASVASPHNLLRISETYIKSRSSIGNKPV